MHDRVLVATVALLPSSLQLLWPELTVGPITMLLAAVALAPWLSLLLSKPRRGSLTPTAQAEFMRRDSKSIAIKGSTASPPGLGEPHAAPLGRLESRQR